MTDAWQRDALKRLESIFKDHFLDDSIVLSPTSSPDDIEAWDSLAHVNLLAEVEASFAVRFTAEEMGDVVDIPSLLQALRRKGAEAA